MGGAIETALGKLAGAHALQSKQLRDASGSSPAAKKSIEVAGRPLVLNHDSLRHGGVLPPDDEEHKLTRSYRAIKRPLIINAFGKKGMLAVSDGALIAVTSALSGEGKTFTCVNLALSIAQEKDCTVTLVDGDFAKRHITEVLGAAEEPGLMDLLSDEHMSVESVLCGTDVPHLTVLPVGRPRADATELLGSKRMVVLAKQLVSLSDSNIVLFDTPPLLETSDSVILAGLVGQILLVVKAGSTGQESVAEAVGLLDGSKAIMAMLNQANTASYDHGYYGYDQIDSANRSE
ncbi:MAG: AAA family ATPase [Gammaproteobacteria bacterium]|nr:AAA family ATPase [Gammaproteobacteria bacterium]